MEGLVVAIVCLYKLWPPYENVYILRAPSANGVHSLHISLGIMSFPLSGPDGLGGLSVCLSVALPDITPETSVFNKCYNVVAQTLLVMS